MVTPPKKPATRKRKPAVPKALALKDSKLEDFLPLLLAEKKLRQCAAQGKVCEVDGYRGECPEKATEFNRIRGEFLRYMILGGCEKSPVNTQGVQVVGAFIEADKVLDLDSVKANFEIGLVHCRIDKPITLIGADVHSLVLKGARIHSLTADLMRVSGAIHLGEGFEAYGEVRFGGATIGKTFDCSDGRFLGQGVSLLLDGSRIDGSVFLSDEFEAAGAVHLMGCRVSGDLNCSKGRFSDQINFQNIEVGGNVTLDGDCRVGKSVNLSNARIRGNLDCQNGKFLDPNNTIIANRAKIEGNVKLSNMESTGTIAFTGSEIDGDFTPQEAVLAGSPALQLRNINIGGTLHWRGLEFVVGEVDLSGASCKTINTGQKSWFRKRKEYKDHADEKRRELKGDEKKTVAYHTKLDNFTYQGFSNLPDNCKSDYWIEWLKQQPDEHLEKKFKPRPWEQLANVLDSMGYEEEARDVRIEKQKLLTNFMIKHERAAFSLTSLLHWLQIFFRLVFWGPLVAYGYRPGNAIAWLFGFVLIGTVVYDQAARRGIMTPTHPLIYKEARYGGLIPRACNENWVYFPDIDDPVTKELESCGSHIPSEYSEFQAFIYAADVALPVVNLRMEDDWAPRVVRTDGTPHTAGWWVRVFEWFLIAAGWILSLLFVSAVGSSIRR